MSYYPRRSYGRPRTGFGGMTGGELARAASLAMGVPVPEPPPPTFEQIADEDLTEARTPRVGKTVEVRRGRKVPRGTSGEVTRVFTGEYGTRIAIDGPDGTVWTAATNADVVDPENWLGDWQEMAEDAADLAIVTDPANTITAEQTEYAFKCLFCGQNVTREDAATHRHD